MKPRSLLVAAVLLAALSGAVWWAKKHPESANPASSTASTNVKLLDVPADQIQQITVKKKDGSQILLKRQSGKWQIVSPENLPADQDSIATLTSALAPLNADSVVEEKSSDTAKYGLNSPSLMVSLTRANGATDTVTFGDDAPAGSLVYAQHGSDPKIYAVNSSSKGSFDKTVNDLRDKRLLTFSNDKLTGVEVEGKKGPVAFGKNNQGDWQIVKPAAFRADSFQVEDLIRKLQDARMDLSGSAEDQKKAATLYSTGEPATVVKVSDSSGTQSLEVRKNKTDYYAKSSVVSGIYKVSSDLGSALDKGLVDFRAHKLYDFGFSDPTKIEFRNGATDSVYQKSGQDWKLNGKTMDAGSVQSAIDQVRDVAAAAFPTTGFADPSIEITVVSNDGKRTEKIAFAKTSEKYIAKREGESALYEVNAKNVDDIVKAFGQIKPAAAPAKK